MIVLLTDIPHPRGHLAYPLKMHPHLRNPSKSQYRRRLADNASTVLSSLRIPLSRRLHAEHAMEHDTEDILYPELHLHPLPYATGLCTNKGT
jgi:hypothetical protein